MGILGLTTFLNQYTNTQFATSVCLTDCLVIVDGLNGAFYLYHHEKEPNAHKVGGDYIGFANRIRKFFQHMKNAGITPVVVFDGAHEKDKFWTVNERFRKSVEENVKTDRSQPPSGYVPVGLKAAFIEILTEQNIICVQTIFEADDTIARLANIFNAPVISSDSDFQVYFGVELVIPFQAIEFRRIIKNERKVFALQAKVANLKDVCWKVFDYKKFHIDKLHHIGLVFGNDKFGSRIFENFLSNNNVCDRFASFLTWFKEQEFKEPQFPAEIMRTVKTSHFSNEEKSSLIDNMARVLNSYSHHENMDNAVIQIVKIRCQNLKKQLITTVLSKNKSNKKSVASLEEELCSPEEVAEAAYEHLQFMDPQLLKLNNEKKIPIGLVEIIRNCDLSTEALDILANHRIWLWPQAEATSHKSSQAISIPILMVIAGILGCTGDIEIHTRVGNAIFKDEAEAVTSLPQIGILPNIFESNMKTKGEAIFLETLGCVGYENFINEWPPNCRFAVITLLYFLRQNMNDTAVGVGVLLSILKPNIESNNDQVMATASNKISDLLRTQRMTKNLKSFYSAMEKTDKLGTYDLTRVYHYCEYKSIFTHSKTLNVLLGNPYRVPKLTSLNSYIVYHVQEATSSKFFDQPQRFVKNWLEREPIGNILLKFLAFTANPTVSIPKTAKKNPKAKKTKATAGERS